MRTDIISVLSRTPVNKITDEMHVTACANDKKNLQSKTKAAVLRKKCMMIRMEVAGNQSFHSWNFFLVIFLSV